MNKANIMPPPRTAVFSGQTLKLKTALTHKVLAGLHQPFNEFRKRAERVYAAAGLKLKLLELDDYGAEAFKLEIGPGGAIICARDARGMFYGHTALMQVMDQCPKELPCCIIEDSPEVPLRAFHLDLRVHRYKPAYLRTVFAELTRLRYNAVLIQYDDAFPFKKEPCLTGNVHYSLEAITEIARHADAEGLLVIPYLTVLGPVDWITQLERYTTLATPAGRGNDRCIDTANPKAARLMCGLAEELIAAHKAPWLFMGTADAELPAAQPDQADHATYLDTIAALVVRRDATPVLWADMVNGTCRRAPDGAVVATRCGTTDRAPTRKEGGAAAGIPCRSADDTDFARDTQGALRRMQDVFASFKGVPLRAVFVTSSTTVIPREYEALPVSRMHGGRRMHLASTWYAIAAAAEQAWRGAPVDEKQFHARWPRYWFGADDSKFGDIQFNHSGCVTDSAQAPSIIRDRRRVIQAARELKPARHGDQLAMLDFFARLAVHALHVRQMFSRTPSAQQAALLSNEIVRLKSLHASVTGGLLLPAEAHEERSYYFGHTEMLLARLARKL